MITAGVGFQRCCIRRFTSYTICHVCQAFCCRSCCTPHQVITAALGLIGVRCCLVRFESYASHTHCQINCVYDLALPVYTPPHLPFLQTRITRARAPLDARSRMMRAGGHAHLPGRGWGEQLHSYFLLYRALPQNFWKFSFRVHKTSALREQHCTRRVVPYYPASMVWLRMGRPRSPPAVPSNRNPPTESAHPLESGAVV